ncbi:MAG: EAL domain-containing protein [Hydrogenovibrio sp.]
MTPLKPIRFRDVFPLSLTGGILLVGALFIAAAMLAQLKLQLRPIQDNFHLETQRLLAWQQTQNQKLEIALSGLISVHQNSHEVNRYNQILFAESQLKQVVEVTLFGLAPTITQAQLSTFTETMRAAGFENYRIRCFETVPSNCTLSHPTHFPIQLIIPFRPHFAPYLGQDLASLTDFAQTLALAQQTQRATGLFIAPPLTPHAGQLVIRPYFAPVLKVGFNPPDKHSSDPIGIAFAWIRSDAMAQALIDTVAPDYALQLSLNPRHQSNAIAQASTQAFTEVPDDTDRLLALLPFEFQLQNQTQLLLHQQPWQFQFRHRITANDLDFTPVLFTALAALLAYSLMVVLLYSLRLRGVRLRQENEHIRELAYFDSITGLPNKLNFIDTLKQMQADHDDHLHVMVINIFQFRKVQESRGHDVADRLLQHLAAHLQQVMPSDQPAFLARIQGAEFAVVLVSPDGDEADTLAQQLLQAIEQFPVIEVEDLHFTAHAGLSHYPRDGRKAETLVRRATAAMSFARQKGPGQYQHFYPELETSLLQQSALESHLYNALENDEFSLVYQPQLNLHTGRLDTVEVLLRWHNPKLGTIPPDRFIPILEQNLGINSVGDWVIDQSLHQLSQWRRNGCAIQRIAVNLSAIQLAQPNFIERLQTLLAHHDLPADAVELELTERAIMTDAEENIHRLNQLSQAGFRLSVDDFGTGYSSLNYLKAFPLNILKIDKSFIDGLPLDNNDAVLTHTVIQLAHNLGMTVVAEGVESAEQGHYLHQAGCETLQGYWINRPLTAFALENWLNENQPAQWQALLPVDANTPLKDRESSI